MKVGVITCCLWKCRKWMHNEVMSACFYTPWNYSVDFNCICYCSSTI